VLVSGKVMTVIYDVSLSIAGNNLRKSCITLYASSLTRSFFSEKKILHVKNDAGTVQDDWRTGFEEPVNGVTSTEFAGPSCWHQRRKPVAENGAQDVSSCIFDTSKRRNTLSASRYASLRCTPFVTGSEYFPLLLAVSHRIVYFPLLMKLD